MEDPRNGDPIRSGVEEDHMAFVFHPPKSWRDCIALSTDVWELRKEFAKSLKASDIAVSLRDTPLLLSS
jgi:hypothetical protein